MATVKLIPIKSLKEAKHNPPSRIRDISGLAKSIGRVGLLDPIKVSASNEIIDGHRRVAAYKKLGLEEIECLILAGDAAENYAELNSQSKKISGNETLCIYLENPKAVSSIVRLRMEDAIETVGEPMMKRLAKEGLSLRAVNLARTIVRANGRDSSEDVLKCLKWLMHFGAFGVAQKALNVGAPPSKLWACIERHKQLRATFDVAR